MINEGNDDMTGQFKYTIISFKYSVKSQWRIRGVGIASPVVGDRATFSGHRWSSGRSRNGVIFTQ